MIHKLKVAILAASLAVSAQAQDAAYQGYRLGPDDTVQVIVYGQAEFNVSTRVKHDGTIVMPLIGIVKAEGETNISLAKQITDKLVGGGFLKAPLVNIEVGTYVSRSVNVAGNVGVSGIYSLDRPYHALEILLKAGWVRADAANFVYLRRNGQPVRTLQVEELVKEEDAPKLFSSKANLMPLEIQKMQADLKLRFGKKAKVTRNEGGVGKVEIPFTTDDDLERIISMLGLN
jgi:polysaccharide export outer membrane protein